MFQNLFSTVVIASKTTTEHQVTLDYNVKTHNTSLNVLG